MENNDKNNKTRTQQLHKLKTVTIDRGIKYRLEEKRQQQKNERNKLSEKNRQIEKIEITPMNDTYTVPEKENGYNRRRLLELWRKEREEKRKLDKQAERPVFKVYHVDPKDFTNKNQLCHHTSLNSKNDSSLKSGPITRSQSKKMNLSAQPTVSTTTNTSSKQQISTIANQNGKFTFSAILIKKTNINKHQQQSQQQLQKIPLQSQVNSKKIIKNNNNNNSSSNYNNNNSNNNNNSKKLNDELLICYSKSSAKQIIFENELNKSTKNTIYFEDFCQPLFEKNDDIINEVNIKDKIENQIHQNTNETTTYNQTTKKTSISSNKDKLSYRKSKSGIYKIDMQSSILELDEEEYEIIKQKYEEIQENPLKITNELMVEKESAFTDLEQISKESQIKSTVCSSNKSIEEIVKKISDLCTNSENIFDYYELNGVKRDVKFYRNLVIEETKLLNDLSIKWHNLINEAPDDVQGDIRSAIGLARLLIDERFSQFIELVDQSEFGTGDKLVKCSDLQGFWDMVDFQIVDVKRKFDNLDKLRLNSYVEIEDNVLINKIQKKQINCNKPIIKTKKPIVKSKFAAFKTEMLKKNQQENVEVLESIKDTKNELIIEKLQENKEIITTFLPNITKTPLKQKHINSCQLTSLSKGSTIYTKDSDTIKFQTPSNQRKCVTIQPTSIKNIENSNDQNILNNDEIDILGLNSFKPISWRNSIVNNDDINLIKIETDQATTPTVNRFVGRFELNIDDTQHTPKTPHSNRKSIFPNNQSQIDVSKSPLLKMVYISSHGKRLSKSGQQIN